MFIGEIMTLTKANIVLKIHEKHPTLSKDQVVEVVEIFLRISKESLDGGSDLI